MLQLKEKCVYDVKTIVKSITQGARNELERLRAIWVWLCHNIGGFTGLYILTYKSYHSVICKYGFFLFVLKSRCHIFTLFLK